MGNEQSGIRDGAKPTPDPRHAVKSPASTRPCQHSRIRLTRPTPRTSTFHRFPNLPSELQLEIWEQTAKQNRIIDAKPASNTGSFQETHGRPNYHYKCNPPAGSRTYAMSCVDSYETYEKVSPEQDGNMSFDTKNDMMLVSCAALWAKPAIRGTDAESFRRLAVTGFDLGQTGEFFDGLGQEQNNHASTILARNLATRIVSLVNLEEVILVDPTFPSWMLLSDGSGEFKGMHRQRDHDIHTLCRRLDTMQEILIEEGIEWKLKRRRNWDRMSDWWENPTIQVMTWEAFRLHV